MLLQLKFVHISKQCLCRKQPGCNPPLGHWDKPPLTSGVCLNPWGGFLGRKGVRHGNRYFGLQLCSARVGHRIPPEQGAMRPLLTSGVCSFRCWLVFVTQDTLGDMDPQLGLLLPGCVDCTAWRDLEVLATVRNALVSVFPGCVIVWKVHHSSLNKPCLNWDRTPS